jgi:hypothetical protein
VTQLQTEHGALLALAERLQQSVLQLQGQIQDHVKSGCQVVAQQAETQLMDEVRLR